MLKNGNTGYFLLCIVGIRGVPSFMPDVRDKAAAYEPRLMVKMKLTYDPWKGSPTTRCDIWAKLLLRH